MRGQTPSSKIRSFLNDDSASTWLWFTLFDDTTATLDLLLPQCCLTNTNIQSMGPAIHVANTSTTGLIMDQQVAILR